MAPINEEFDGFDMSNNLLSDFGPLIALLGEQPTRQFLSMSLGWADNVLLAMCPIGVITIIVSAIRVGGLAWLKGCVGMAREERSVAEQELLSSTSRDICEMWSGKTVVRTKGQPLMGMPTLVITSDGIVRGGEAAWMEYLAEEIPDEETRRSMVQNVVAKNNAAPNLGLVVNNAKRSTSGTWALAVLGMLVQLGALTLIGIMRYHWLWPGPNDRLSLLGYPFCFSGSILLAVGIAGCGRVIESATVEQSLKCPKEKRRDTVVVRLQRSCRVGDQYFESFAIFNPFDQPDLHISPWKHSDRNVDRKRMALATSSSIVTVVGLFMQCMGIRALHWSAAPIQLVAMCVMTVVRTYLRRTLSLGPPTFAITPATHEIAWLALGVNDVCKIPRSGGPVSIPASIDWKQEWERYSKSAGQKKLCWEVVTGGRGTQPELLALPQLDRPLKTAIRREIDTAPVNLELQSFAAISKQIPDALPPGVAVKALQRQRSIEAVAELFRATNLVIWKNERLFDAVCPSDSGSSLSAAPVIWEIHIRRTDALDTPAHLETVHYRLDFSGPTAESGPDQAFRWRFKDISHLQGTLCFWLRTLALRELPQAAAMDLDDRGFYATRHFFRIVGSSRGARSQGDLAKWMGWRVYRLNKSPDHLSTWTTDASAGRVNSPCFGTYMSHLSTHDNDPSRQEPLLHIVTPKSDIVTQCAQELFALFISAITAEVSSVHGTSSVAHSGQGGYTVSREWDNSLLTSIAAQAVWSGLVDNLEEALTLVIPAFSRCDLLPGMTRELPPADGSSYANGSSSADGSPPRQESC